MTSHDLERIEALVREGRITRAEGDELAAAARLVGARRGGERPPEDDRPPSAAALAKARFLRGETTPDELRAQQRAAAVHMGAFFGLAMAVVMGVWGGVTAPDGAGWLLAGVAVVINLVFSGPLFGWAMHRILLKPAAEKLIALVQETGRPLVPLPSAGPGQCPTCSAEDYSEWGRWHPYVLHYELNPGLAFNELALGQRAPSRVRVCRQCGTHFVACPGCGHSVDGDRWRPSDVFGRWRGLSCPDCGHAIPSLRNVWAGLVLRLLGRPAV